MQKSLFIHIRFSYAHVSCYRKRKKEEIDIYVYIYICIYMQKSLFIHIRCTRFVLPKEKEREILYRNIVLNGALPSLLFVDYV